MQKLKTIQTKSKLNEVYRTGEKGNGEAYHKYTVTNSNDKQVGAIQFQDGARNLKSSKSGVLDVDLLEIVRDRLICFQNGEFANDYNAEALVHIEEALECYNKRVENRIQRNVLGTNMH